MTAHRFENFGQAFLVQKLGEFLLLSLCLGVHLYFGSRQPDPSEWGIFGSGNVNVGISAALQAGLAGACVFFLFTLYPLVTLLIVAMVRKSSAPLLLPWFSALVSVSYVGLWVFVTRFEFVAPFWIVTAIMAAFIVGSSVLLYPPGRSA